MINNHSTLDNHEANLNTFSRWLWRTNPTLYSDSSPNEKFDRLPYMTMQMIKSIFADNLSWKHFNPTSCDMVRNQSSKVRRFRVEWFKILALSPLKGVENCPSIIWWGPNRGFMWGVRVKIVVGVGRFYSQTALKSMSYRLFSVLFLPTLTMCADPL